MEKSIGFVLAVVEIRRSSKRVALNFTQNILVADVGSKKKKNKRIKYEIIGDVVYATLKNKKTFFFDLDDFEKIEKHGWYITEQGYIVAKINAKRLQIHRFIMNCDKKYRVDHINGNRLDNKKENLRIVTQRINAQNRKRKKKGTLSRFFGVSLLHGKWFAQIYYLGKNLYLGSFPTEEEAALAYNKKAEEVGYLTRNIIESCCND